MLFEEQSSSGVVEKTDHDKHKKTLPKELKKVIQL